MRKILKFGLLAAALTSVVYSSYALLGLSESNLENKTNIVYSKPVEQLNYIDPVPDMNMITNNQTVNEVDFSKDELEPYISIAAKSIKAEFNIDIPDSCSVSYAKINDNKLYITLSNRNLSDENSSFEYYAATFENIDIDSGVGSITEVVIAGNRFEDMVNDLKMHAAEEFSKQFNKAVPPKVTMYPTISIVNGAKNVKLQWEGFDYLTNNFIVFEAVYEQVNNKNTDGTLVYLNNTLTNLNDIQKLSYSQQDINILKEKAQQYANDLGYNIINLNDYYIYDSMGSINFCFNIEHNVYNQLNISLNSNGDLEGRAVGNDILKYSRFKERV